MNVPAQSRMMLLLATEHSIAETVMLCVEGERAEKQNPAGLLVIIIARERPSDQCVLRGQIHILVIFMSE